jgi:hypothetical protein
VNSSKLKGSQILTYCFYAYEAQRTFVSPPFNASNVAKIAQFGKMNGEDMVCLV